MRGGVSPSGGTVGQRRRGIRTSLVKHIDKPWLEAALSWEELHGCPQSVSSCSTGTGMGTGGSGSAEIPASEQNPRVSSLPSHRLSVQPCLDVSDPTLLKMGLSKLLWDTGRTLLSECAKQHRWFPVTFQSETRPKGGERKPPLTRAVHRDPANRWCLHRGYSVGVQLHYNALLFMIAGGLNSGSIWSS